MKITGTEVKALAQHLFWSTTKKDAQRLLVQIASRGGPQAEALTKYVENHLGQRIDPFTKDGDGAMRLEDPWVTREDLVLSKESEDLLQRVKAEHAQALQLETRGLYPVQSVLLHGPSGCGKTSWAALLAKEMNRVFLVVPMDLLVGQFLGQTSARLRLVFETIEHMEAVVLLDELDAIACTRGGKQEVGEQTRMLTTLLTLMDGFRRRRGKSILVAATNRLQDLDPAVTRRFEEALLFKLAGQAEQIQIAQRIFEKAGVPFRGLAWRYTENRAPSYVETWALRTVKEAVLSGNAESFMECESLVWVREQENGS